MQIIDVTIKLEFPTAIITVIILILMIVILVQTKKMLVNWMETLFFSTELFLEILNEINCRLFF